MRVRGPRPVLQHGVQEDRSPPSFAYVTHICIMREKQVKLAPINQLVRTNGGDGNLALEAIFDPLSLGFRRVPNSKTESGVWTHHSYVVCTPYSIHTYY